MIEPREEGKLAVPTDAVSMEFRHLKTRLGISAPGLSFYCLRHCFETRAGESIDQPAVNFVMGHLTGGMDENYRHSISDQRLRAVVNTVRHWLFTEGDAK